jgi:small subunit ribosomal protein S6e
MKVIECDDEKKLVYLFDKRQAQEVDGDFLGDEYKGYVFRLVMRGARRRGTHFRGRRLPSLHAARDAA